MWEDDDIFEDLLLVGYFLDRYSQQDEVDDEEEEVDWDAIIDPLSYLYFDEDNEEEEEE